MLLFFIFFIIELLTILYYVCHIMGYNLCYNIKNSKKTKFIVISCTFLILFMYKIYSMFDLKLFCK